MKILRIKVYSMFFILIPLLIFIGCDREEFGIFYSLENEQPTIQSNLRKEVSVTGIVFEDNTYFAAAGNVFRRATDEDEWSPVNYPSGFENTLTLDLVDVNGITYAAFSSLESESVGLFPLNTEELTWGENLYSDNPVTAMFSINDILFITVESESNYSLLQYDGSQFISTSATDTLALIDGAYSTTSGEYWFITPGTILKGADPASLTGIGPPEVTLEDGTVKQASNFSGIFSDNQGDIYIATLEGYILKYTVAEDRWDNSPLLRDDTKQKKLIQFTDFESVPHAEENGIIVVGTKGKGYYEIPQGNISEPVEPSGNAYYSIQLSEVTIQSFSFFGTADTGTLFALTIGNGLWRTDYSSNDPVWFWE